MGPAAGILEKEKQINKKLKQMYSLMLISLRDLGATVVTPVIRAIKEERKEPNIWVSDES